MSRGNCDVSPNIIVIISLTVALSILRTGSVQGEPIFVGQGFGNVSPHFEKYMVEATLKFDVYVFTFFPLFSHVSQTCIGSYCWWLECSLTRSVP